MYVSWHTLSSCVLLPLPVALVSVRVMAGQVSGETRTNTSTQAALESCTHYNWTHTLVYSLHVRVKHAKISLTHTHTHTHKGSLASPLHTNTVHVHTKTSNSSWDGCKVLSELDTRGDGGVHYGHRNLRRLKQKTVGLLILCNQHLAWTSQKTIM